MFDKNVSEFNWMKRYYAVSFLFVLLFAIGCNNNESPRPVAEKFINAFQRHDFETAAKYGTRETAKMLKQLKRIEELEEIKPEVSNKKIQIVLEEIDGNKATIYFIEEGSDSEEKIRLENVIVDPESKGREWRVALSKTDIKVPKPFNGPAVPDSLQRQIF